MPEAISVEKKSRTKLKWSGHILRGASCSLEARKNRQESRAKKSEIHYHEKAGSDGEDDWEKRKDRCDNRECCERSDEQTTQKIR